MTSCTFCKIRDGRLPAKIVHRDEHVLGFEDIRPQAPAHMLFVPLEHVATANDFSPTDAARIGHLFLAATKVARDRGFAEKGYRLVLNCNGDAGQTVFHVHLHLLAGRPMKWPPG
jgi:histidine triad (HIT) family protein